MSVYTANILGIASLVLWSMNVAVTRFIGEAHPYAVPGLSFCLAGILLIILDTARKTPPPWKSDASPKYWLYGGGAFVVYILLYTMGLSWSDSRLASLSLGLVNYFWPSLILLLLPWFFPARVRAGILALGLLLCLVGVGCALLWGLPVAAIVGLARDLWPAFLIMLAAAFLWAFYSNAARKWGGNANGVGWFQLATGLCFLLLWAWRGGELTLNRETVLALLVHALLVNAAAYMLWDCGIRRGDIGLMGTLANFLPLTSVLFGAWYLGSGTTPGLWLGGALVTVGAILCRRGIRNEPDEQTPQ